MPENYSVPLTQLVEEFHLQVAFAATDFEKIHLTVEDVARPGLQLAGYFDHFEPMRLQVMGNAEVSYIKKLSEQERKWLMPGYSFLQMNASLEVIRFVDSSRASKAEAVMKEVALLAARRFVEEKGADGPWLSAAGDLACAVAMVARIESIAKILGPELNEKWEKLADDCIFGLNGQPPLWESHPDRIFSLLSAKFRLGK